MSEPMASGAGDSLEYAGVGARIGALVVDAILYFAVSLPLWAVLSVKSGSTESYLRTILVPLAYFTGMWALRNGQTIGMKALGVRVMRRDGGAIGIGRAAVRTVGIYFSLAFFPISLLAVLTSRDRRSPATPWPRQSS